MNRFTIYYDLETGHIDSWDNGDAINPNKEHMGICRILLPLGGQTINPRKQRIDVDTKELIDKTREERLATPCVGGPEISFAIQKELMRTDALASPPQDRVVNEELVEAYKVYRQALRDLSKPVEGVVRSPDQQVRDWPTEPKGFDAVSHLRERMEDI